MGRKDYDDKVRALLGDQKTYRVLKLDPTQKNRELKRMLSDLKREKEN